jgi:hypothetical protein
MTVYQLTFDPNPASPTYGITLVHLPGQQVTDNPSEFPQVNIGTDNTRWVARISALFSNWAMLYCQTIVIQVADNGNCSAWML